MLNEMPFLKRAFKGLTAHRSLWVILIGLDVLAIYFKGIPPSDIFAGMLSLAVPVALIASWRSFDDDQAAGALEHLEVLPVSRLRIAVEVAAGNTLALLLFVLAPVVIGLPCVRGFPVSWLPAAALGMFSLAFAGTVPSLRFGMRTLARVLVYATFACCIPPALTLAAALTAERAGPVVGCCAMAMMLLALSGTFWCIALAFGGGWSAAGQGHARRSATSVPGAIGTLTPSWINPLLWRELKTGLRPLAVVTVLGVMSITSTLGGGGRHELWALNEAEGPAFWLLFYASCIAGWRTSRDRLDGIWGDIAVTPLRRRSILTMRIAGITLQMMLVSAVWFAFVAVVVPASLVGHAAIPFLVMPAVVTPVLVLSGFATGTGSRGYVSAMGGIALVYCAGLAATMPTVFIAWAFERIGLVASDSPLQHVMVPTLGLALFFAILIGSALRGLANSIEAQTI